MLNCTFIGVKTNGYKRLVDSVRDISDKHAVKAKLDHINNIDDILQTRVKSIPSIRIMPGNTLLVNPNYKEIETVILNIL